MFLTAAPDGTVRLRKLHVPYGKSNIPYGKSNSAVRIVFSGESPGRGKKPFNKNLALMRYFR
ncbi:hypothetical protein ABID58_006159 [Bradyrhizobium sp. S3.2.6]